MAPSFDPALASGDSDPLVTVSPTLAAPPDESPNVFPGDKAPFDAKSRYSIIEEIGRGGVGVVYAGWDADLERKVAIKRLWPKYADRPEVVERFLNEARITSRLQHPGIVPIYDSGVTDNGLPYLVMGLVRGESFDRLLGRRTDPRVDLLRMLTVLLQICEAVAYAHAESVIHRDLKPSNVVIGAFGVVKVIDWGSAKILGTTSGRSLPGSPFAVFETCDATSGAEADAPANATQLGTVFGTPAYIPPEQARGESTRIDRRSDVFGLGSILCEILTGYPPYAGAYGSEVFRKAANADTSEMVARLESADNAIDLISLTRWCLSERPRNRPRDAAEVVEVLESYLHSDQRRAEEDLVRFFDLSPDLFCIASYEGYFLRVNENFPRALGYTAAELISRPFVEFVHPEDRERTRSECTSIAFGADCVRFRNRFQHAEGGYRLFEWNARSWPEDRAIYAVARDITEREAVGAEA